MGQGYTMKCIKCNYGKIFSGVEFSNMKTQVSVINGIAACKYGNEIQTFYEEHLQTEVTVTNEIYHFDACDNLKLKERIRVYTNTGYYEKCIVVISTTK